MISHSYIEVEPVGVTQAAEWLSGISSRLERTGPAFDEMKGKLEAVEERAFAGGRLVLTGALRDSLTQPGAEGAIREAHDDELVFGTSVEAALYHEVFRYELGPVAARSLLDYVVHGGVA